MKCRIAFMFFFVLLSANIAFAVTPDTDEFTNGHRTKFNTKGHPKSDGLNMVIAYPNSWSAEESGRANIVKMFSSNGGMGPATVLITAGDIPLPDGKVFSDSQKADFFLPDQLEDMMPDGAKLINAKSTRIAGMPAGILEYSTKSGKAGNEIDIRSVSYIFIHGRKMIQLQCMVFDATSHNPEALAQTMDDFKPLFSLMADSIVLQKIRK